MPEFSPHGLDGEPLGMHLFNNTPGELLIPGVYREQRVHHGREMIIFPEMSSDTLAIFERGALSYPEGMREMVLAQYQAFAPRCRVNQKGIFFDMGDEASPGYTKFALIHGRGPIVNYEAIQADPNLVFTSLRIPKNQEDPDESQEVELVFVHKQKDGFLDVDGSSKGAYITTGVSIATCDSSEVVFYLNELRRSGQLTAQKIRKLINPYINIQLKDSSYFDQNPRDFQASERPEDPDEGGLVV